MEGNSRTERVYVENFKNHSLLGRVIQIIWDPAAGVESDGYQIKYRIKGTTQWEVRNAGYNYSSGTRYFLIEIPQRIPTINDLPNYEVQIGAEVNGVSAWSEVFETINYTGGDIMWHTYGEEQGEVHLHWLSPINSSNPPYKITLFRILSNDRCSLYDREVGSVGFPELSTIYRRAKEYLGISAGSVGLGLPNLNEDCAVDKKEYEGLTTAGHNTYTIKGLLPNAHYYVDIHIDTQYYAGGSGGSSGGDRVFQVPNADGSFTRDAED